MMIASVSPKKILMPRRKHSLELLQTMRLFRVAITGTVQDGRIRGVNRSLMETVCSGCEQLSSLHLFVDELG